MATHTFIRPAGVWFPLVVVKHEEFAAFDAAQVDSISASGGTYSPVAPITVGGAGMQVVLTGTSTLPSGATLASAVGSTLQVGGTLTTNVGSVSTFNGTAIFAASGGASFAGLATFASAADFVGTVNIHGSSFLISAPTTFSANPLFSGNPTFSGSASVLSGGTITYASGAALVVAAGATETVAGTLVLSGAGTIVERVVIGTDSTSTYSVSTADIVYITRGTITGAHDYSIDEVGAVNGKKVLFHREDNTSSTVITLKRSVDGSTICLLTWDASGYVWTYVVRIAGRWERVGGQFGA